MNSHIPFLGFYEPISSFTHLLSAITFLVFGLKIIFRTRGNSLKFTGICIYITCAIFLFSMSGVYHLLPKGTTSNYVLRILDHAGIYLMISGSFVPFQIILLRGVQRWVPLIIIWVLAITGVSLTSVFFDDMPSWLLLVFFISMGWMSVFTVWFIRKTDITSIKYLFAGGLFYTIGAIIDYAGHGAIPVKVFGPHEVFHIFVSLGAFTHLYAVNRISYFPISDKLVVMVKQTPERLKAYFTTENTVFYGTCEKELRQQIKSWIDKHYLDSLKPKVVKLKYFQEDFL